MPEIKKEEEMSIEGLPEENMEDEFAPTEDIQAEAEVTEEAPPAEMISISADDFPSLSGMNVGDTITLIIQSISEDGNMFDLGTEPVATEEASGREAVSEALL